MSSHWPAPLPLDLLKQDHPYEREVKVEDVRIVSDDSNPVQDKAHLVDRFVSIFTNNHWRRYLVIKVARNYGETQILCQNPDETRVWVSTLGIQAIRVWKRTGDEPNIYA